MSNIIACRFSVYQDKEEAFELLPQIGIRCLEVRVPETLDFKPIVKKAGAHDMRVTSVANALRLDAENRERFRKIILSACEAGIPKIFASIKGNDEMSHQKALSCIRDLAQTAHRNGATICMETHPPFGTNGDVAVETIQAVESEGLRYNFDTANIYYYNQGCDALVELKKCVDWVASVHLKETDGGYESPNFPVLGEGIVDFPAVFRILGERGFEGPYTLELEGALTAGKSLEKRHEAVTGCMAYLRGIGVAD